MELQKRRSSRVTKRRRYEDNENFPDLSDDEHILPTKEEPAVEMEPTRVEDQMVVEKIMLMRTVKVPKEAAAENQEDKDKEKEKENGEAEDETEVEQFYCKFKNLYVSLYFFDYRSFLIESLSAPTCTAPGSLRKNSSKATSALYRSLSDSSSVVNRRRLFLMR